MIVAGLCVLTIPHSQGGGIQQHQHTCRAQTSTNTELMYYTVRHTVWQRQCHFVSVSRFLKSREMQLFWKAGVTINYTNRINPLLQVLVSRDDGLLLVFTDVFARGASVRLHDWSSIEATGRLKTGTVLFLQAVLSVSQSIAKALAWFGRQTCYDIPSLVSGIWT